MKLHEISKADFHQKLVDPVKAEFLERLKLFKKEANDKGFMVEVYDEPGIPFQVVSTHIGQGFLGIQAIIRILNTIANDNILDLDFLSENDIKYQQGSDGAIKVVWEIYFE